MTQEPFPTECDAIFFAQNHAKNTWKKATAEERELIADTVHYVYGILAKAHRVELADLKDMKDEEERKKNLMKKSAYYWYFKHHDLNEKINNVERLAELEHEQWIAWSKSLVEKEKLSVQRVERWKNLWIPYDQLPEEEKEHDRKWAKKVILILKGKEGEK